MRHFANNLIKVKPVIVNTSSTIIDLSSLSDEQSSPLMQKDIEPLIPTGLSGETIYVKLGAVTYELSNMHPDYYTKGLLPYIISNLYFTTAPRNFVMHSDGSIRLHTGGGPTSELLEEGNILIVHPEILMYIRNK